jgi:ABC-type uncharacterized transport system permease subunit
MRRFYVGLAIGIVGLILMNLIHLPMSVRLTGIAVWLIGYGLMSYRAIADFMWERGRPDTSPIPCKWLDDQTWECGHCAARNGWFYSFCHFCQRGRSDAWGES